MSFKWPSKDPNEYLDYSLDWSRFLGTAKTITSVSWFIEDSTGTKVAFIPPNIVDELQNFSILNTTTIATIYLKGGTLNKQYKLFCQMTDSSGLIAERSVFISIKDK